MWERGDWGKRVGTGDMRRSGSKSGDEPDALALLSLQKGDGY